MIKSIPTPPTVWFEFVHEDASAIKHKDTAAGGDTDDNDQRRRIRRRRRRRLHQKKDEERRRISRRTKDGDNGVTVVIDKDGEITQR